MNANEMIKKYNIILTADGNLKASIDTKKTTPAQIAELKAAKQECIAILVAEETARTDRLAKIAGIEGLKELEAARSAEEEYRYNFNKAMDSESSVLPAHPTTNTAEIAAKYPRAAAYLMAQGYTMASNVDKYSAGTKAIEKIINGEDYEAVITEMKNWGKSED